MTPLERRNEVHARRCRKGLTLGQLARRAEVNYFAACRVLKGRENNPAVLKKLESAVAKAPKPREEVCA